ncbi:transcription factor S [Candidatus Woesearchaeota archaeon]|nr:transcription factor S [Candidatus Woesearchaeota archaeon]
MFCPNCGSILRPIEKKGKKVLGCSCGYLAEKGQKFEVKEKGKKTQKIEVIEQEVEAKPLVDATCPKCKHKKAYFWEVQTRASDEPATRFFKCEKCKHTWREYS